jgi:uncharacterized membrane protein
MGMPKHRSSKKISLLHIFRRLATPTIALLLAISYTEPLSAKSYTIDKIAIHAQILSNGDMHIEESRTYHFKGKFSWADYRLPLKGIGEVRYFSLKDDFHEYRKSGEENRGTYYTQMDQENFYCRWFYQARNETRTFTLQYQLTDVVTRYQDIAEFYYKFVGEANSKRIESVSVTVELPEPAIPEEVKAFAHGPLWGNVGFWENSIQLDIAPLPPYQHWEARILFPPGWVPEGRKMISSPKLQAILLEEENWAQVANEQRIKARERLQKKKEKEAMGLQFAVVLSLLAVAGLLFFYSKYGKGFDVPYHQKVDSELPKDQPPAVVSALYYNKQVYGTALSSTLFHLAERGIITIKQTEVPHKKWWGTSKPKFSVILNQDKLKESESALLDYERDLLNFIFQELGEGQPEVALKRFQKKQSKVQKWFRQWKKLVGEHYKDVVYYDQLSVKGTIYSAILSGVVVLGGAGILIALGTPGIIAIFCGSLCLGLSFLILRYTPEIKLKRKKWGALREYLKKYHFSGERSGDWLQNIQDYLIYGLALGVGNKAIEKMMETVPADQQAAMFPWYNHLHGSQPAPADFASAISSMVTVASSTMSSSTGSGGGASGGGGGGGGGASGGAG